MREKLNEFNVLGEKLAPVQEKIEQIKEGGAELTEKVLQECEHANHG